MTALRPTPRQWFFIAVAYYAFAITNGRFALFAPVTMGMTFNSMLLNLLDGRFDVDPEAIMTEGFVRDGKTYAYFGIMPALLRLPLLAAGLLDSVDLTTVSCVIAASLAAYFKVSTVRTIQQAMPSSPLRSVVFGAVIMAIIFGGPQVQFLKPSVFQEPASWAGAIAAAYVYVAFQGLVVARGFSDSALARMSGLAGLALITRVSTGLGLYISTGLLLSVVVFQSTSRDLPVFGRLKESLGELARPRRVAVMAILMVFVAAAGIVNYGRWGNAATFADLSLNLEMRSQPARMERLAEYGELNPARIWFSLLYYFLPVTMAVRPDGKLLFQEFQFRMVDGPELPPSSFFISDPMLMVLVGLSIWILVKFRRWGVVNTRQAAALMAGLAVPPLVVCMAIYLAFRYRLDFYPLLDLAALLGLYGFAFNYENLSAGLSRKLGKLVEYSVLMQILTSHTLLIAYKASPFGDPSAVIARNGILNLYWEYFRVLF